MITPANAAMAAVTTMARIWKAPCPTYDRSYLSVWSTK